jgi:hypothetical protein
VSRLLIGLPLLAASLLCACASRGSSTPFDQPRVATVLDAGTPPENGYDKVRQGISAGMFGVLSGMEKHEEEGGSVRPASMGAATGGLVDNAKVAVDDACTRQMVVAFQDDGKKLRVPVRCNAAFAVGQKVSIVRNPSTASVDPRDVLLVTALP